MLPEGNAYSCRSVRLSRRPSVCPESFLREFSATTEWKIKRLGPKTKVVDTETEISRF